MCCIHSDSFLARNLRLPTSTTPLEDDTVPSARSTISYSSEMISLNGDGSQQWIELRAYQMLRSIMKWGSFILANHHISGNHNSVVFLPSWDIIGSENLTLNIASILCWRWYLSICWDNSFLHRFHLPTYKRKQCLADVYTVIADEFLMSAWLRSAQQLLFSFIFYCSDFFSCRESFLSGNHTSEPTHPRYWVWVDQSHSTAHSCRGLRGCWLREIQKVHLFTIQLAFLADSLGRLDLI